LTGRRLPNGSGRMTNPTPTEQARLDQIEAALAVLADQAAPLKAEKAAILSRVRQRGHYARQKPAVRS
jgi:hypothetical protein